YVSSTPRGDEDLPLLRAGEYSSQDRLIAVDSLPPILWPMSALVLIASVLIIWIVRRRYARSRDAQGRGAVNE
ncbi:MAG: hypothetical protein ACOCVQ_02425, partial [Bacillota bacterium]